MTMVVCPHVDGGERESIVAQNGRVRSFGQKKKRQRREATWTEGGGGGVEKNTYGRRVEERKKVRRSRAKKSLKKKKNMQLMGSAHGEKVGVREGRKEV